MHRVAVGSDLSHVSVRATLNVSQEKSFVEHIDPEVTKRFDTRSSRPCEFCRELDSEFSRRSPLDQMIATARQPTASAHLTEDGYVRHRILELRRIGASTAA